MNNDKIEQIFDVQEGDTNVNEKTVDVESIEITTDNVEGETEVKDTEVEVPEIDIYQQILEEDDRGLRSEFIMGLKQEAVKYSEQISNQTKEIETLRQKNANLQKSNSSFIAMVGKPITKDNTSEPKTHKIEKSVSSAIDDYFSKNHK